MYSVVCAVCSWTVNSICFPIGFLLLGYIVYCNDSYKTPVVSLLRILVHLLCICLPPSVSFCVKVNIG